LKAALEKLKMDLPFKGNSQSEVLTQKVSSTLEVPCSKRMLPRALVFKARGGDFDRIKELIKSEFPDVEIVYVTTGSAECFLRVTNLCLLSGRIFLRGLFILWMGCRFSLAS
jgi:hypothetical protein